MHRGELWRSASLKGWVGRKERKMVDPRDIHAECLVVDDFDKIEACIFVLYNSTIRSLLGAEVEALSVWVDFEEEARVVDGSAVAFAW
jgi:hypothetical protein